MLYIFAKNNSLCIAWNALAPRGGRNFRIGQLDTPSRKTVPAAPYIAG